MKSKSGFTLIEVLVVIAVVSIISSIIVFAFITQQRGSRDTKRSADLVNITEAFDSHYHQTGSYPLACGVSSVSHLACGGSALDLVYTGSQPVTITPTTQLETLSSELPQIPQTFGNPSARQGDPPINHTIGGSIATTSYFVLSPDLLPGQLSPVNGSVSFFTNPSHSSTFSCNFTLQPNTIGHSNTKPHRYIVGFYSEASTAWKFYISPMQSDANNLQWTSSANPNPCQTQSTGELKLLSSS